MDMVKDILSGKRIAINYSASSLVVCDSVAILFGLLEKIEKRL